MSYRKKHVRNKIVGSRPKKHLILNPFLWLGVLIVAVLATGFYFFFFYSGLQIKNISISGNQKVSSNEIKNIADIAANKKIFSIFGWKIYSKSIFLADTENISKQILSKFPVISTTKINKNFPQTLNIQIEERSPAAVFCPSMQAGNNSQCFYIDNQGVIFEPTEDSQDFAIVRQVIEDKQVFSGEQIIQKDIMDLLLKVEKSLKDNFKIDIREALVASPDRLNLKTSENWLIYFGTDADSDTNFEITKLNLLLNNQQDNRKNLRYVDLRPKDRAVICDNSTCGGK